jgi:hypothetical protein
MWGPIAKLATDIKPQKDGLFNIMNWVSGVIMIYATLFGVGKIVLGETLIGIALVIVGLVFGAIIYVGLNKRGWETLSE